MHGYRAGISVLRMEYSRYQRANGLHAQAFLVATERRNRRRIRAGLGNVIMPDDKALPRNVYLHCLQRIAHRPCYKVVCADKAFGAVAQLAQLALYSYGAAVVEFVVAKYVVALAVRNIVYCQRLYHSEISVLKTHAVHYVADKAKPSNAVVFVQLSCDAEYGLDVACFDYIEIARYGNTVRRCKVDKANGQFKVYQLGNKILVKRFYRYNAVGVQRLYMACQAVERHYTGVKGILKKLVMIFVAVVFYAAYYRNEKTYIV